MGGEEAQKLINLLTASLNAPGQDGVCVVVYPGKSKTTGKEYAKVDAYTAKPGTQSSGPRAAPVGATAPAQGGFAPRQGYTPRR